MVMPFIEHMQGCRKAVVAQHKYSEVDFLVRRIITHITNKVHSKLFTCTHSTYTILLVVYLCALRCIYITFVTMNINALGAVLFFCHNNEKQV